MDSKKGGVKSKIIVIFLEVLETHLIFVDLSILETVFDLVQSDLPSNCLEHRHHILRDKVTLSA